MSNGNGTSPEVYTNSLGMEFVLIPAGEFCMGSLSDEKNWYRNERPLHKVSIMDDFFLGRYEVTQQQWTDIMGINPSRASGDDRPVDKISWNEAQEFIRRLNEKEVTDKYRLPTEAEWEYACRAGTTSRYSFGDDEVQLSDYGWYGENESTGTFPVGQKKPNPWGLYDMHGNLWEWVRDRYHESYEGAPADGSAWEETADNAKVLYVLRGGSWITSAVGCRSASRYYYSPDGRRSRRIGVRIVKEV
ncbi:MAG: formylglycine-generating enzyme family protein [Methanolobus sp.]|uniref:formylglycine-generating enzyme family protein n=1 Tax=Methanolobus sp. TaxID=1874737 RepID=UPI0027300201|nr:formylglycine-generating enzyme family protein [Methanolobus sp.]MDP2218119.1 formylglycine-generating enzyme family protein [Methanolobus sp.]